MLSRLKWMFTSKQNRIPYVLEWYEKCIAVHPRMKRYIGRFTTEIVGNELRFVIHCSEYSSEQLWKVGAGTGKVGTGTGYTLYTSSMEYPYNSEFIDDFVHTIARKVDAVDAAVEDVGPAHLQEGGQLLVVAARDEPQEIVLIVFVEDDLYGVGVVRVLHVPLEMQGLTNTQIVPYEVGIVVLAAS